MRKIFAYLLLSLATAASAEVTVINQVLQENESWTVPEGKVLLLSEAAGLTISQITSPVRIRVYPPEGTTNQFYYLGAKTVVKDVSTSTGQPLHILAGTRFVEWNGPVVLIGRLVDPADLYASVPSQFEQIDVNSAGMETTLAADSPRPAKVEVEESTDGTNWEPAADATVASAGSGTYEVHLGQIDAPHKAIRGKVVPRRE